MVVDAVEVQRRRTSEVRVKLSPVMADELSAIAEGRGVPPATLAAVALGEYVERYKRDQALQRMVAIDTSKRMSSMFTEEHFEKVMVGLMSNPVFLQAIQSAPSPEEGAAGQAVSSAGTEAAAPSAGCAGGAPPEGDRASTAT